MGGRMERRRLRGLPLVTATASARREWGGGGRRSGAWRTSLWDGDWLVGCCCCSQRWAPRWRSRRGSQQVVVRFDRGGRVGDEEGGTAMIFYPTELSRVGRLWRWRGERTVLG